MDRFRSCTRKGSDAAALPGDVVVFNVRGRHFEVLPQLIRSHGGTLLASLLDDIGTDGSHPVFVDANPERFAYILDWYRYGEMFVPSSCPVEAVLRDARFLLLPDLIRINGEMHSVSASHVRDVHEDLRKAVVAKWPTFESYVQRLVSETRAHAEAMGSRSDEVDTGMLDDITWE